MSVVIKISFGVKPFTFINKLSLTYIDVSTRIYFYFKFLYNRFLSWLVYIFYCLIDVQRVFSQMFRSRLIWQFTIVCSWLVSLNLSSSVFRPQQSLCIRELGWVVVFNVTFNNISVILCRSVLLAEAIGVPGKTPRLTASHWQTLSHDIVSSTPRHQRDSNSQL